MHPSPSHAHSHSHAHGHSHAHNMEPQMMSNSPNYGGGGGQFYMQHPYQYANQMSMSPHASAAQHVAGPPLYVNNPPQIVYPYYHPHGMMYSPAMVAQPEMTYSMDEKGEEHMAPDGGPNIMSPVWMEYQQMENQMNAPAEEFMQQPPPDEYGGQHPEEYIHQSPSEFMQPSPHQQPNEFIPQQINEYNQQNQVPPPPQHSQVDAEEFVPQHQQDGQGFIYGPPSIGHQSPIHMNQVYKQNYTPEFIPQQQQPPPPQHSHGPLPVEFLQPEHNELIHREVENTITFDAYNENDKEIQFDGHPMDSAVDPNIIYTESNTQPQHSVENVDCDFQFMQSSDINIQTVPNAIDMCNQQPPPLQHQQFQQQIHQQYHQQIQQQQSQPPLPVPHEASLSMIPVQLVPMPPGHIEHESIEQVLVQQVTEKLIVNVEPAAAPPPAQEQPPPPQPQRKSTQSVAISAVPSNNGMASDQTAGPVQFVSATPAEINKLNLDINNVGINSRPVVSKSDDRTTIATTHKSSTAPETKASANVAPPPVVNATATVTTQSFEMQTTPVDPTSKFSQSDFGPLGARAKDNAAAVNAEKANAAPSSWASLFAGATRSSAPPVRPIEQQRQPVQRIGRVESPVAKPTAKIPPNNTKEDGSDTNKTVVTASAPASTATSSSVVTNLSYSAASTQNMPVQTPPSNIKKPAPTAKATVNPSLKPVPQSSSNESSLRLGGRSIHFLYGSFHFNCVLVTWSQQIAH